MNTTSSGEHWSPLKKLQQHSGTKNLTITEKKRERQTASFLMHHPTLRVSTAHSTKEWRGHSPGTHGVPLTRKGRLDDDQLLQAFRAQQETGFGLAPPRQAKLQHLEVARNKVLQLGRGYLCWPHSGSDPVLSDHLCTQH